MKVRYYMWLIDMSVMLPSVKRDVRNVDNNDGCNSQSAEEFSDYSDFSHISRRSKDTKKDVSLCRRRLHSVVQRKASIDSNSRGEYAENYSRSSDQKPSNLNFRSRARQREKQYRRTRHDNSFSGDNESMQSDDDRDHRRLAHRVHSSSSGKHSSTTLRPKAKCIVTSYKSRRANERSPDFSATENSDNQYVYDSESDYSLDKQDTVSKDKLRNSRKSKQEGVARAVKINADVLNADLDHDDHTQQGARDKNLSSKANRIHHHRSSR